MPLVETGGAILVQRSFVLGPDAITEVGVVVSPTRRGEVGKQESEFGVV